MIKGDFDMHMRHLIQPNTLIKDGKEKFEKLNKTTLRMKSVSLMLQLHLLLTVLSLIYLGD